MVRLERRDKRVHGSEDLDCRIGHGFVCLGVLHNRNKSAFVGSGFQEGDEGTRNG